MVNSVLMDGFHVFDDVPRADGPANLKRKSMSSSQRVVKKNTFPEYSDNLCITFQPVALKVFPPLPTVMVRSHIPGRLAVNILMSLIYQ